MIKAFEIANQIQLSLDSDTPLLSEFKNDIRNIFKNFNLSTVKL